VSRRMSGGKVVGKGSRDWAHECLEH